MKEHKTPAGSRAPGWSEKKATPDGSDKTPAPRMDFAKLKVDVAIDASPPFCWSIALADALNADDERRPDLISDSPRFELLFPGIAAKAWDCINQSAKSAQKRMLHHLFFSSTHKNKNVRRSSSSKVENSPTVGKDSSNQSSEKIMKKKMVEDLEQTLVLDHVLLWCAKRMRK